MAAAAITGPIGCYEQIVSMTIHSLNALIDVLSFRTLIDTVTDIITKMTKIAVITLVVAFSIKHLLYRIQCL